MSSPTQRTLAHLRKRGYAAGVVERRNPKLAHVTHDLLGFIDVMGFGPAGVIAVQATSYSNVSARVRKVADSPHVGAVREAGVTIEVHGWRRVGNRWQVRVVDVS